MLCFCVFLEPLSYQLLGAKSPSGLNFEGLWVQFFKHSEQIMQSENYDSVWEWTRKIKFMRHMFELFACFGCKGFLDISFSFILRFLVIFHIFVYPFDLQFGQHLAMISAMVFKH